MTSTCGDARNTGDVISNGARSTSAYVVTIPRSAISRARTCCGSAPSTGSNVVIARRFVQRLDDAPPLDVGKRLAGHPADLGEPLADLLGPGGQILAQRDRIANACSHIGLTLFEALRYVSGKSPLRWGQPRPQALREIRPNARNPTPRGPATHLREEL